MPQAIEMVSIKTPFGNRVYPLDTRVYSNVGGKNLYLRKYIGDLTEGEMILWYNKGIEKTLPEVEPALRESPGTKRQNKQFSRQTRKARRYLKPRIHGNDKFPL